MSGKWQSNGRVIRNNMPIQHGKTKGQKIQEASRRHGDSVRRADTCPANPRRGRRNRNKAIEHDLQ